MLLIIKKFIISVVTGYNNKINNKNTLAINFKKLIDDHILICKFDDKAGKLFQSQINLKKFKNLYLKIHQLITRLLLIKLNLKKIICIYWA
jgi:hypothetical protein